MGIMNKDQSTTRYSNKKQYFERWSINLVDAAKEHIIAIIVGILFSSKEPTAFIQISSNIRKGNTYITYPVNEFSYDKTRLTLGNNIFCEQFIELNIEQNDFTLKGKIEFSEFKELEKKLWMPGLMGPIKWLPFLSSYHEILSLGHYTQGSLTINHRTIDFGEGKGYMEKDWGKSFPKVWLWSQCNHFSHSQTAMMLGVARMPILFDYYTAFVIPIYFNDKLEIYANYTGAHIAKLYRYKEYIHLIVTQKDQIVEIKIFGDVQTPLLTTWRGHLIRDVYECLSSKMEIKITKGGRVIFEDIGVCAGLKIGGNTSKLK